MQGMQKKYTLFKDEDIQECLTPVQRAHLRVISATIDSRRIEAGKTPASNNAYIVINTDEPYAAEVVEILKRHGHRGE